MPRMLYVNINMKLLPSSGALLRDIYYRLSNKVPLGAQKLLGRVLDLRSSAHLFETHSRYCVVCLKEYTLSSA